MDIKRCGATPTRRAAANYFTGTVWQDPVMDAPEPARLRALIVRFDPGARTHWHTHPLGQTLHVLSGAGLVQVEGGPVTEIHAGDSVWFAPGERHWHGASPTNSMTHLAMQEALDGEAATWMEPVSDAEYAGTH